MDALRNKMKILFIGNSATYVHDIPETLARLATQAGHPLEVKRIVKGGWRLCQHAGAGSRALEEIEKGYDIVFLQDNGDCISSEERREACLRACTGLTRSAQSRGAKVYYYVRPPYGYEAFGRSPLEQCQAFDLLFGGMARETGAVCAYVNRAFAYAIKNTDICLWGDDNAHTSEEGAYLAVCVFFAVLFGRSSSALGSDCLPKEESKRLQDIADRVVLYGELPWDRIAHN